MVRWIVSLQIYSSTNINSVQSDHTYTLKDKGLTFFQNENMNIRKGESSN